MNYFKVVREDLTSVGLLRAPRIQYKIGEWVCPLEPLSDHYFKGGGLWVYSKRSDAFGGKRYIEKKHGIKCRVFSCQIGMILNHTPKTFLRVKTDKVMLSEELKMNQRLFIAEVKNEKDIDVARVLVKSVKLSPEHLDQAEILIVSRDNQGHIVGCLGLERRDEKVYLQSLAVSKEMRRRRIGSAIVNYAFDKYLKSGEIMIALTLFWNNKFYYSLGFQRLVAQEVKRADDIASRPKHRYCVAFGKVKK